MATTTYGTEYVQSSDLVSNWPGSSLNVANRIDDVSLKGNGLNDQTGTSYTLVLTDGGKNVTLSNASAVSLTVPTNASVAFPNGTVVGLVNKGAGLVTVAGAGGVTVNGPALTIKQNETAELIKLATNTWQITSPTDPGLTLITTQTFSAVATLSVNNCFDTKYDNYRIVIQALGTVAATVNMAFRLRVGGVDLTTGVYFYGSTYVDQSAGPTRLYSATNTSLSIGNMGDYQYAASIDIFGAALARQTVYTNLYAGPGTGSAYYGYITGWVNNTTIYDGFTIFPASSNMTGTVRVYGYKN